MNIQDFYCIIGEDYLSFYNRLPDQKSIASFVKKFPGDENYEKLLESISEKNYAAAYQYAMTLKGIALNLSFTKLADVSTEMIDYLKNSNFPDAKTVRQIMHKITEIYTNIIVSIQQYAL